MSIHAICLLIKSILHSLLLALRHTSLEFSMKQNDALVLLLGSILLSTFPVFSAQSAFNDFSGGCAGASARLKIITKSLLGEWSASGKIDLLIDSTEHYISSSGKDLEKNCYRCCVQAYNYDARISFRNIDSFGNIAGFYRTTVSDHGSGPDQEYLSQHSRVYKVDCDSPDPSGSGEVSARIEILVHRDASDLCDLSTMSLKYLDTNDSYTISMSTPSTFTRSPVPMDSSFDRIYHKQ